MENKPVNQVPVSARLDKHFAGCSAAAVGVASFFANQTPADASIVYSGIQNVPILTQPPSGGVYINLEPPFNFAEATRIPGWSLNPYRTGQLLYVSASTRVVLAGANAANLAPGTPINGGSNLSPAGRTPPWYGAVDIAVGSTGFIGFAFDPESVPGAQEWYGWARMSVGNNTNIDGSLIDWAYDNTGAGIQTGAVPEPASFAMGALAMGAMGLVALRQRRAKAAK
jgi:hypothetical protein